MNIFVRNNFQILSIVSNISSYGALYRSIGVLTNIANGKLNKNNLPVSSVVNKSSILWIPATSARSQNTRPRFHADIEYPNFDYYRKQDYKNILATKWGSGEEKPTASYFVAAAAAVGGMYSAKSIVTYLVMAMAAPKDVVALSSIEVDLTKVPVGTCVTFKWRGKPLFVKNRTEAEIEAELHTPASALRDPATQEERCKVPEWLIVIGICTHLGCVPIPNSGDWDGGFYCPCHGSHYDNMGRMRKGPAPLNLEIPPYRFASDTLLVVG